MAASAHPNLISAFIYLCSRVRQLTPPCTRGAAGHAHLSPCIFICPVFCVGFSHVCFLFICMLRGSVSIAACRGVHDSFITASAHFLKENRILMDRWKHFTWNLNNCSVKEAFRANPVSHLLSGNDFTLNPGRVMRGTYGASCHLLHGETSKFMI